jgi:hypothetical protein
MSGKRPSLAESMRQAANGDAPPSASPAPAALPTPAAAPARAPVAITVLPPPAALEEPAKPPGFYAATRAGKKKVTATLAPAAHKQLKGLAVEHDATTEALLTEAINDLFVKYGKSKIA